MSVTVRPGGPEDGPRLKAIDPFTGDLWSGLETGELWVAYLADAPAAGFAVVKPGALMGWPLITAFAVRPEARRRGVATALLAHLRAHGPWPRLFVSTEGRNAAMQATLAEVGAVAMGTLNGLNPDGEPELFFRL